MTALTPDALEQALAAAGYTLAMPHRVRVREMRGPAGIVYIQDNETGKAALVVHPDVSNPNRLTGNGLRYEGLKHNSNMTCFPRRLNTGAKPIPYGHSFTVESEAALDILLRAVASEGELLEDLRAIEDSAIDQTEKEVLAKARIGQGLFRERLMAMWNGSCVVTGCSCQQLLVASHIKRWRDSTDTERLDAFNGLLLIASLDRAFEHGYVTFSESGELLFSSTLRTSDRACLGVGSGAPRVALDKRHQLYLAQHRAERFLR